MRKVSIVWFIGVASAAIAQTNVVISPFNSQDITGTQTPFLIFSNQAPSVRYQQVFDNSDFFRFGKTGPFRFDTGAGSLDVTLANVQLRLSPTQREPDGLSTTFNQNIGTDETTVFSGALHLC